MARKGKILPFLGAFAQLRKATISLVMSVCPHGTTRLPLEGGFHEILCLSIFLKYVERVHVSFIRDENNRVLYMTTNINFWSYVGQFFLEWAMLQTNVAVKINAYILCSITFFLNHVVYEIMWKNTVVPDSPQMTIWRMRIACRIPKATHTLTTPNTYCFSNATVVVRTHLNVTLYAPCSWYLYLTLWPWGWIFTV